MDYVLAKDLASHSYILTGKNSFFLRFCDTGFKNKWCGYWFNGLKFLDYFAFKVNEEWLSPENCKVFEYNHISSSHVFSLRDLDVKEFLYLSDKTGCLICLLNFKNKTPERIKVDLKLEAGINIRSWNEDWHERKYEVKFFDNKLLISSEKGFLVLSSFPFPTFEHKEIYRDHFPGGEKERVFIPGDYNISFYLGPESGHEVFFIFSPGEKEDSLKNFEKEMENFSLSYLEKEKNLERIKNNSIFKCNLEFLEKLFEASVLNLEKLWFDSKVSGYLAGYPWFLQIWVRDLAWVLPAVIDYGEFEKARKSLETIFKFQYNGRVPNVIFLDGKASYNSSDSTPLALIALEHYIMNSADVLFIKDIENKLEEIIEFYKKNKDENGFIFSNEKESWMDTLSREGKVLEIQAFWAKALRSCSKLFEILGKDSSELEEMALNLEKNLEKEFWNENEKFYFDRIFDSRKYGEKTLNAIFPILFKISKNWKNVIERIESDEFTTDFGIRTISKEESLYNPSGYHTGSTWAWLVALFSAVEFLHKREKAFDYLKILSDRLERNCIYSLEEAWNSENGGIVLFKDSKIEESAYLQAWSSLAIRAIDEFMLGIRINAFENKIFVSPFLKDGMKVLRRKRIGNDWVDLIFKKKGRGAEISYKSQKGKEYKIIKAPSLD